MSRRFFQIQVDLEYLDRLATDLALRMADSSRPGHAARMAKIANYAKGLAAVMRVDDELPPDLPTKSNKAALPDNVKRLRG